MLYWGSVNFLNKKLAVFLSIAVRLSQQYQELNKTYELSKHSIPLLFYYLSFDFVQHLLDAIVCLIYVFSLSLQSNTGRPLASVQGQFDSKFSTSFFKLLYLQ